MVLKPFQEISLLGLLLEVGRYDFQLFEGERLGLRFHARTKWRRYLTAFGTVSTFFYGSFQIFQLISKVHSIDQVALDVVWIIGNVSTFVISLDCLWNGHDFAAFASQFLQFVERFKGNYEYSCRYVKDKASYSVHLCLKSKFINLKKID
jgi:hypothetical protein